ncbi:MAG TPA: hypothetical protein DEA44_03675 [Firmicutes bacterium]|nr:hypothetical protein [Bacillota bacterium]HWR56981.1 hypothetical protein [Negativicutes bacterium]
MKKHWIKVFLAVFLGLLLANTAFASDAAKVYAAEQGENQTEQQQTPSSAEEDNGGHAGHHG